ncbi:hypothetical protein FH972_022856 [Carpinus fangiana]|uniref:Uncharacterized protein n=1 Tax=Carpinus fangiana TaxID=176857 RepID=A0A5N6KTG2_9ROSI|nr:hypothetical protein FH972_022856 [Carpinus fangiana]
MLTEEPRKRPTIYEVLSEVCSMRGKAVPIKDIYANRTASEARSTQRLPQRDVDIKSPPMVGASIAPPEEQKQAIPDIAPMRRGRPTSSTMPKVTRAGASPGKSANNDPFAALDSSNYDTRAKAVDELSGKFPALEDFSLLQSRDAKFKETPPRSHSASSRPEHKRSSSQQLLDFPRAEVRKSSFEASREEAIDDNVEFLRAMEEQDQSKGHRRSSSKIKQHFKNASMSSVPKGLFGGRGKLGDTLKRFEGGSKSPNAEALERESFMDMPPEGASQLAQDDEVVINETEDLSPEMRRELERRRLSQEERRVADAAAAYRQQVNGGGPQRGARASAIQDRTQKICNAIAIVVLASPTQHDNPAVSSSLSAVSAASCSCCYSHCRKSRTPPSLRQSRRFTAAVLARIVAAAVSAAYQQISATPAVTITSCPASATGRTTQQSLHPVSLRLPGLALDELVFSRFSNVHASRAS